MLYGLSAEAIIGESMFWFWTLMINIAWLNLTSQLNKG